MSKRALSGCKIWCPSLSLSFPSYHYLFNAKSKEGSCPYYGKNCTLIPSTGCIFPLGSYADGMLPRPAPGDMAKGAVAIVMPTTTG